MTNNFFKIITLQYLGLSPDPDRIWTRPRVQVQGPQKVARPDLDRTMDSLMATLLQRKWKSQIKTFGLMEST